MLELMRMLFSTIWKILDIPLKLSDDIIVKVWHFWAFALILRLIYVFIIGGGKNEVD